MSLPKTNGKKTMVIQKTRKKMPENSKDGRASYGQILNVIKDANLAHNRNLLNSK